MRVKPFPWATKCNQICVKLEQKQVFTSVFCKGNLLPKIGFEFSNSIQRCNSSLGTDPRQLPKLRNTACNKFRWLHRFALKFPRLSACKELDGGIGNVESCTNQQVERNFYAKRSQSAKWNCVIDPHCQNRISEYDTLKTLWGVDKGRLSKQPFWGFGELTVKERL